MVKAKSTGKKRVPIRGAGPITLHNLSVTFNQIQHYAEFAWALPGIKQNVALGRIFCTSQEHLTWELIRAGKTEYFSSTHQCESISNIVGRWIELVLTNKLTFAAFWLKYHPDTEKPFREAEPPLAPGESSFSWLVVNIADMAKAHRVYFSPLEQALEEFDIVPSEGCERSWRKMFRKDQKRVTELAQNVLRRVNLQAQRNQLDPSGAQPKLKPLPSAKAKEGGKLDGEKVSSPPKKFGQRLPVPIVPVLIDMEPLRLNQEKACSIDLKTYLLRENAALWWISNQSDDLLCLPNCRIRHLDHQLRTALRVLGPLRGRALLSDEVGLGKTIEAGLVIKELLTRGMIKRFLILTVPSLVDQWEEELGEKFLLPVATTNHPAARDSSTFWSENSGIVASLHTLKQPAQLEYAGKLQWDILVVDEAHYLRNRESQAWKAVNALPRQYLLLLTATPVQNSIEELYNLVTLLQPGQLPTPKEFRARFIDPKRPRQPRETEQLRRLLGQVMIRNTRSNAGIELPPRQAESVVFGGEVEGEFWQKWEREFRACLLRLSPSQGSLWGRLVLQAAGSSPAAWLSVLKKFPDPLSSTWRQSAPLENSWRKKCELLKPLTAIEGGVVIFSQFLETQAAVAQYLHDEKVKTFVVNGATPPDERQPITQQFQRMGGALLLTHSGTEGRNLQFCHQLVNFDLPWNPMEIEQRIGRLHRLGQLHPVRIYNFVQAGTLQEHLLQILQEKLNLFELVVGETGLVLGDRFSSDEFAEEVLRRWRHGEGRMAEAFTDLGEELAAARDRYGEIKELDATLFAKDYESL